jgi:Uncharacterized conserved protein
MSQTFTPAQKKALLIKLAMGGVALVLVGWFVLRGLNVRVWLDEIFALMREVGPWAFFGAMAVLPAFGFPLSPFWLTAGPVFAPTMGFAAVVVCAGTSLFINLVLTYWIARYACRPPLAWLVRKLGYELPRVNRDDQMAVTVLVRVTPGPPFFIQGYLLGLAEIPFKTYLLGSWPIAMAFGVMFIYFGDSLAQGKGKLALIALGGLIALGAGLRFVRKRMAKRRREAGVESSGEETRA